MMDVVHNRGALILAVCNTHMATRIKLSKFRRKSSHSLESLGFASYGFAYWNVSLRRFSLIENSTIFDGTGNTGKPHSIALKFLIEMSNMCVTMVLHFTTFLSRIGNQRSLGFNNKSRTTFRHFVPACKCYQCHCPLNSAKMYASFTSSAYLALNLATRARDIGVAFLKGSDTEYNPVTSIIPRPIFYFKY